jgi:multicomponent Na+:H+ antiporter subunit B
MDAIIRTSSRIVFPAIMLFGVYVALHGHLSPGGAFPAGVVLASGLALMFIAFGPGDGERGFGRQRFGLKDGLEMSVMIFLVLFGCVAARDYLLGSQELLKLWSGGYTIIINSLAVFMISAAIFIIVHSMAGDEK